MVGRGRGIINKRRRYDRATNALILQRQHQLQVGGELGGGGLVTDAAREKRSVHRWGVGLRLERGRWRPNRVRLPLTGGRGRLLE